MFLPRKFQQFGCPTLTLNHNKIRFVVHVKYLVVYLSSTLNDDDGIARQIRYIYCCTNMLKYRSYRCSRIIKKNNLFRSYCTLFYSSQLWPELGTCYLRSSGAAAIWQKSSDAAACRYLNKKVAPLQLLTKKTAAAAATLEKYLIKKTMASKYGTQ